MKKLSVKKLNKLSKTEHKNHLSLTLVFSGFVFIVLLISIVLTAALAYLLARVGLINIDLIVINDMMPFALILTFVSLTIGFGMTVLILRYPLKPITNMITQINRLADGDYTARLEFGKYIDMHPSFKDVSESFNKMAVELEGTEMLSADFVNNFSHEFKTPIVSIAGFAKLLKRGNLTDEQKMQYIDIIEEESLRLADMATNVLNMTKIESHNILTDLIKFNLSEQIRSSVLLLEDKWVKKETEFSLDFGEYYIIANEELLKQIWINLIGNAIKFSQVGGRVSVDILDEDDQYTVRVSNTGSYIKPESHERIFNKFYQADESHASEGNGVGLAVVKRIVELHGGEISVESEENLTTFIVELPKNQ